MALFVHTYVRTPVACMYVCTYALTHLDILFNEFFVVADEFNEEHLSRRRHITIHTYICTYVRTYTCNLSMFSHARKSGTEKAHFVKHHYQHNNVWCSVRVGTGD